MKPSRFMPALVGLLFAIAAAVAGPTAAAQPAAPPTPADVVSTPADGALPSNPDGYASETRGEVRWDYPQQARSELEPLMELHEEAWDRISSDFGRTLDGRLTVRVGRNPTEMAELAPEGAPPPAYAVGVAYPTRGLILLTMAAPSTWQRPDLIKVYEHELSHVALHRAVDGNPVPRWFTEGVATYQAGEFSLDRYRVLVASAFGDTLMSLDEISRGFPNRPHAVNLAYAQSASFVQYLLRETYEARNFRILVRKLREGKEFSEAIQQSYHMSLSQMERDWRQSLAGQYKSLPMALSGGAVWVLGVLFLGIAYVRRRRYHHRTLRRWGKQEAAEDHAREMARQEAERRARAELEARFFGDDAAATRREPDRDVPYVIEIPDRDTPVPTVDHDGSKHTLH